MVTYKSGVIGLVAPHSKAHSNNASRPKSNALFNDAAAANKAACANMHIAVEDGAGGNMTMVFDCRTMLKQRTRIDDAVVTHPGASVDYCPVHHDGACADGGVTGDMSARRDDGWQLKPEFVGLLIEADAVVGCLNLAHSN